MVNGSLRMLHQFTSVWTDPFRCRQNVATLHISRHNKPQCPSLQSSKLQRLQRQRMIFFFFWNAFALSPTVSSLHSRSFCWTDVRLNGCKRMRKIDVISLHPFMKVCPWTDIRMNGCKRMTYFVIRLHPFMDGHPFCLNGTEIERKCGHSLICISLWYLLIITAVLYGGILHYTGD